MTTMQPGNAMYIPFEDYHWIGGPATFMRNLRSYLDRHHHAYTSTLKTAGKAKVLFFPNAFHLVKVKKVKRQGGYIIQRLDGIHYPSKHGEQYVDLNRHVKDIYLRYADMVIFQSRYSQAQCFAMFGEREDYQIIVNGVDKSMFYPAPIEKPDRIEGKIRFVTTGRFRNPDMIEPVVKALDLLKGQFEFELTVIGPVVNSQLEPYFQRPYLRHIETLLLSEIAAELRNSDIFLYSHLNPPCPNSVIEAISCGLPVVGFDSGAMAELCFFSQDLLAHVSDEASKKEVFQNYEDFDARRLAEKVVMAVEQYDHYREVALAHNHLYSFEECGGRYWEVFQHYLKRPRRIFPYTLYRLEQGMNRFQRIPASLKSRVLKRLVLSPGSLVERLLLRLTHKQFLAVLSAIIRKKLSACTPAESLKLLFNLENRLYSLEGQEAVRYGNGLHTKHKHIRYHDFFVRRIEPGSRVLDVGCGNGALSYDMATQVTDVSVYGIDIDRNNVENARQRYAAENVTFVCGDALTDLPEQRVDVIVLSNVLEHLEKRIDFLRGLRERYHPQKFLIRVPVFERDWRVPLKEELGIDYRLDPTHYIEYRQNEFAEELAQAGLHIRHAQVNWGEIWAEVARNTF